MNVHKGSAIFQQQSEPIKQQQQLSYLLGDECILDLDLNSHRDNKGELISLKTRAYNKNNGINYNDQSANSKNEMRKKNIGQKSTAKYRQKKKNQLRQLQLSVRNLNTELQETARQIEQFKQKAMSKLQQMSQLNNPLSYQNKQIYAELGSLVHGNSENKGSTMPVNIDKINLLLDTLKSRIGASGRQRQAKLDYHFKTIVNTIFPALYRYLLFTAQQQNNIFCEQPQQKSWQWSSQVLKKMKISHEQTQQFLSFKQSLLNILKDTTTGVNRLYQVKVRLKSQQLQVQQIQQSIRNCIHPIQSAKITLFCQNNKLRPQLFFWQKTKYKLDEAGKRQRAKDQGTDKPVHKRRKQSKPKPDLDCCQESQQQFDVLS